MSEVILSYEKLEAFLITEGDTLTRKILVSHMALQERNEKLRIQNRRLIEVIDSVRKALRS